MGAPGRPLQGDEILEHKLEETESVRWIFGKTKAQVERAAVQRPWGRNVLAVFQAQHGWVEQREPGYGSEMQQESQVMRTLAPE